MTQDKNIIEKAKKNNVVDFSPTFTSSISDWKRKAKNQIEMYKQGIYEHFSYNGPLDLKIINQAEDLINQLPLTILAPEFGINSDGTLLIEWAKRENDGNITMFSLILNGQEIISSLMHAGNIRHYDAALHSEYSLKTIEDILNDYFEKTINPKRTIAK